MIRKRPLCMIVLAVTVLLLLLPSGIWMKDPGLEGRGPADSLTGRICRIEPRTNGQSIYLKSYVSDKEMILIYFDAEQPFSVGNTIRIEPPYKLWEPECPSNPGQFDARLYYQTQHVILQGSAKNASLVDGRVYWPGELLRRLREDLGKRSDRLFGETRSGELKAMLLGDKTDLDADTKNIYQKSGMSHLLAISGLHISIVGMSLYRFLRKRGCSYAVSGSVGLALVLLYGAMTGMSISTARAVTMFALAVLADLLGRSYDMLTALALAALLLLLEQPLYVRNASFLLSFGAVLGVGLFYPAVRSLFPKTGKHRDAFLLSISIQLATLPLIQWFYYEFPLYSVFLNLLVIPLMAVLMLCGITALGISFLSGPAAVPPAFVCRAILNLYEWLGQGTLKIPGSVIHCGKPKLWQVLFYYGGLGVFILWRAKRREREKWESCLRAGDEEEQTKENVQKQRNQRWRDRSISIAAGLLLCVLLQLRFDRGFAFAMLDVGQGDGLFLQTQAGTVCLIDGGSSDIKEVGRYRILPFLKERGTKRLDYVIITHTDNDHISGIRELLKQAGEPGGIRIGTLLMSEQSAGEEAGLLLRELAEENGTEVKLAGAGMILEDRSMRLSCIHPKKGTSYTDKNAGSLVFYLSYGDFTMLLTGDLEETGEREILENLKEKREIRCDILKAGHHGSRFSTTTEWLGETRPALTLISCGEENAYGHPHGETLKRLREAGSRFYLTTEQGAVTVRSDGKHFRVEGYCEKDH